MGLYDDLKWKEQEVGQKSVQFIITDSERQWLAEQIWNLIREGCIYAKRNNKNSYHSRFLCYVAAGAYKEDFYLGGTKEGDLYCEFGVVPVKEDRGYRSVDKACTIDSVLPEAPKKVIETSYKAVQCTPEEQYKILELVRQKLVDEGFPPNVVCADDYVKGIVGYSVFKRGGVTLHTIKVDVHW